MTGCDGCIKANQRIDQLESEVMAIRKDLNASLDHSRSLLDLIKSGEEVHKTIIESLAVMNQMVANVVEFPIKH